MSHVVSWPVYHFTGATPPMDVKLIVAPGAAVGVAGRIASWIGPNASGTLADVDGKCAASPPYIATTSTDCMPGLTRPGGTAPVYVAVPAAVVPPVIVPVPSVQERSSIAFWSYDSNAKVTTPPRLLALGTGT